MTDLARVVVRFVGSAVTGSSSTSFYSKGPAAGLKTAVDGWANSVKLNLPPSLSLEVPGTGEIIDDTTGNIVGSWSSGALAVSIGTGGANYAAGVGMRFRWITGARTRNRPANGSTFLVPISSACYDSDGNINPAALTSANTSATGFVSSMGTNLVIWTRPQPGQSNGGHSTVTGGEVPDKVSWLRSRRT